MLHTNIDIQNAEQIGAILKELIKNVYQEVSKERVLLCMECGDVDVYIATSHDEQLQDAIYRNFQLDEYGEMMNRDEYIQFMDDLQEYFVKLHMESGYFDFFPSGIYVVEGETRESETDILAPKNQFYAPFEDALK